MYDNKLQLRQHTVRTNARAITHYTRSTHAQLRLPSNFARIPEIAARRRPSRTCAIPSTSSAAISQLKPVNGLPVYARHSLCDSRVRFSTSLHTRANTPRMRTWAGYTRTQHHRCAHHFRKCELVMSSGLGSNPELNSAFYFFAQAGMR